MNLLTDLAIINFILIMTFFISRRPSGMKYTEIMVARKIGAYFLTILALVVVGLMMLKKFYAVQMMAWIINIFLMLILVAHFFKILFKGFYSRLGSKPKK